MTSSRPLAMLALAVSLAIAGSASAAASEPTFQRGANLVEFFEFPAKIGAGAARRYADPAFPNALAALSLFDFDELKRSGFDHMRLPLDVGPLMQGDERQQREVMEQVVAVVTQIRRHGLNLLITLFAPSLHQEPAETYLDGIDGPNFRAYTATVERVAAALAPIDGVALEPMNEPQSKCRVRFGTDWTAFQEILVDRIRHVAPQLPVFITGGCASNIEGIVLLDTELLRDPRNFVSVHFYYPFLFTHQTSTWTPPYLAGTIGVPFPASAGSLDDTLALTRARFKAVELPPGADRAAALARAENEIRRYYAEAQGPAQIETWMRRVADWQQGQRVASDHIVFTEFGAMKQLIDGVEIDRASRARWLRDTAAAIANRGWGWNAYVLRDGPFGLYRHESDRGPDPQLLEALRLKVPEASAKRAFDPAK